MGFSVRLVVKQTRVQFLGWEDPVEKGMATHSIPYLSLAAEVPHSLLQPFRLGLSLACLELMSRDGSERCAVCLTLCACVCVRVRVCVCVCV